MESISILYDYLANRPMYGPFLLHPGQPLAPDDVWSAWNFDAWLLSSLGVSALIYLWGTRNAWRRGGAGHGITTLRWASFLGAILALILALVSPLDALSGSLFSAHMTQHLILILIAAPLLVMSDYPLALLWALPRGWARGLSRRVNRIPVISHAWQALASPIPAWFLFTVFLWTWHAPALYEAALRNETIHAVEHLGFLLTAMLFWWVLFRRTRSNAFRYGIAIPYLFATILQSTVLGALMTFTSLPWYPYYTALVIPWGLTPLQDQQLAGLIMWLPGGAVFTLLTIGYFAAWLRALEQRSMQMQQRKEPIQAPPEVEK